MFAVMPLEKNAKKVKKTDAEFNSEHEHTVVVIANKKTIPEEGGNAKKDVPITAEITEAPRPTGKNRTELTKNDTQDDGCTISAEDKGLFLTFCIFLGIIGIVFHVLNTAPWPYLSIPYDNDYRDNNWRTDIQTACYFTVASVCTAAIATVVCPFLYWHAVGSTARECVIIFYDIVMGITIILCITYMTIIQLNLDVFKVNYTDFYWISGWIAIPLYVFAYIFGLVYTAYTV